MSEQNGQVMIQVVRVRSIESKELSPYRTLRRAVEHLRDGIFVAEGEKVVRRLLKTDLHVESMLVTEQWHSKLKPLLEARTQDEAKVWIAPKHILEQIVGFQLHQGVMAVARIPKPINLKEAVGPLLRPHLLVALDGLSNADNIGVIVRNCVAFGVDALVVPKNTSHPYLRRAVRMSMGAVFFLPTISVDGLPETLNSLKKDSGTRIIAAEASGNSTPIENSNLLGNLCIVFGSEAAGISSEVLSVCDDRVCIPTTARVDSLNVATASGIFLFELQRQRSAQK
jgi:tRNA G18 (ribose-2'-O)-methylase SpoU